MFTYRMSGLVVDSEVELPGFAAMPPSAVEADVRFHRAPVEDTIGPITPGRLLLDAGPEHILVKRGDVACYRLSGGREIAYDPAPGADLADVALILAGSVFAILLHQRGQIVLHGSAVRVGGRAVLFCGPSGAGKSTLAAALGQRGYPLLADDVCAIDIAGPVPLVHPDSRWQKLWDRSIDALRLDAQRGEAIRHRARKFYVEPDGADVEPVPVAAVYVLGTPVRDRAIAIDRPTLADAALLIRRNAYRPKLVDRLGRGQDYLRAAAGILEAGGIFQLTRPLDFDAMPAVLAALEDHWEGQAAAGKTGVAQQDGSGNSHADQA